MSGIDRMRGLPRFNSGRMILALTWGVLVALQAVEGDARKAGGPQGRLGPLGTATLRMSAWYCRTRSRRRDPWQPAGYQVILRRFIFLYSPSRVIPSLRAVLLREPCSSLKVLRMIQAS